jgi:hypothetical protein
LIEAKVVNGKRLRRRQTSKDKKPMKKLRNLIAVMALVSMAAVFTGCGDDDDGDDNGGPPVPVTFAPGDEATLTAQNKVYTVTVAGQDPIELTFPSAGNYQLKQGAVTETGTITATKNGETWTINITPTAGQQGPREGVLQLAWTADNTGTWTFTPNGGAPETGTFTVTVGNPNPTTGSPTTGTQNPGPLAGKTLQINYTGGGGDKFQFTSDTAVSWENGTSTGTYTVNTAGDNIDVVLADGQVFDIQLQAGNAVTVIYQATGGAEQQTFSGTYTLN